MPRPKRNNYLHESEYLFGVTYLHTEQYIAEAVEDGIGEDEETLEQLKQPYTLPHYVEACSEQEAWDKLYKSLKRLINGDEEKVVNVQFERQTTRIETAMYWCKRGLDNAQERIERLRELKAPRVILENQSRLIWRKQHRMHRLESRLASN